MKRFWIGLLNGLLCLLACLGLGLALLLACDWLYRADVRLLDISTTSGLSEETILENYHAAVQYLTPWNDQALELRGLTWSTQGAEYFRQLRICVLCVYIAALTSGIGLVALSGARRKLGRKVWNVSGTVTLGLAAALGVLLAVDFEQIFVWFGNTVFSGGSWELYEDLDPIVTIFPQSFFVHAAFFLIFVCAAGALMQFAAGYVPAGEAAVQKAEAQPGNAAAKVPAEAQPVAAPAAVPTVPVTAPATAFSAPVVTVGERKPQKPKPMEKQVFRLRDQPGYSKK